MPASCAMNQEDLSEKIITLFKKFPGIGQRQAERFAHFITQSESEYIEQLTKAISALHTTSKQCPQCFIRHQQKTEHCRLCSQGDTNTLIVVEKDADVAVLSVSIGTFMEGYYFVLGGLIPIANSNHTHVRTPQLINSVKTHKPNEIIIALSAHPDADHTAKYITDNLQKHFPAVTITILGRGLSSGSELEYSDPETLINAFTHRNPQSPKNTEK